MLAPISILQPLSSNDEIKLLVDSLNSSQFAISNSINPIADIQPPMLEALLNYINKNNCALSYSARKAILAKALALEQIDQSHKPTSEFTHEVLEKNSLGVDYRLIKKMQSALKRTPDQIYIISTDEFRSFNPLRDFFALSFVDHLDPTHEAQEIAKTQSKLDCRRNSEILHIAKAYSPNENLYTHVKSLPDDATYKDNQLQTLKRAGLSLRMTYYVLLYLNQRSLITSPAYLQSFFNPGTGFLSSPECFELLQEEFGGYSKQRKIAVVAHHPNSARIEIYFASNNNKLNGKCIIEVNDNGPDQNAFNPELPNFSSIDVSLAELSIDLPDEFHQEIIERLKEKALSNERLLDYEDKLVDQLLLPYKTLNNNRISINKDIINNPSLMMILFLKRAYLILYSNESSLYQACINIALRIEHQYRPDSVSVIKHFPARGNPADIHKIYAKNLVAYLIKKIQNPLTPQAIEELFDHVYFGRTDKIIKERLAYCLLPILQFNAGKPFYTIAPKIAYPNPAQTKLRFLAMFELMCRVESGERKARRYIETHLAIRQGDLTKPNNLLGALVTNGIISVAECFDMQPQAIPTWKNLITRFVLSPNNFPRLQEDLKQIILKGDSKATAILKEVQSIANEIDAFNPDSTPNILSTIIWNEEYKIKMQCHNANTLLQSISPAEIVPPRTEDSVTLTLRRLESRLLATDPIRPPRLNLAEEDSDVGQPSQAYPPSQSENSTPLNSPHRLLSADTPRLLNGSGTASPHQQSPRNGILPNGYYSPISSPARLSTYDSGTTAAAAAVSSPSTSSPKK
jgi:hypothetical protein